MSYDLRANNKELDEFTFGAFSWGIVVESFGYLFPCIHHMGRWSMIGGVDPRFEGEYPTIISNDGFKVTAEETKIMARMMRNFVAIQRGLPVKDTLMDKPVSFAMEEWPRKIREDWVDKFEAFAEWADKSDGFEIW